MRVHGSPGICMCIWGRCPSPRAASSRRCALWRHGAPEKGGGGVAVRFCGHDWSQPRPMSLRGAHLPVHYREATKQSERVAHLVVEARLPRRSCGPPRNDRWEGGPPRNDRRVTGASRDRCHCEERISRRSSGRRRSNLSESHIVSLRRDCFVGPADLLAMTRGE